YHCPVLTPGQEKKLLAVLAERKPEDALKGWPEPKSRKMPKDGCDHSNTQFAVLGLWAARRHDVHVDCALALVEKRFRSDQKAAGWGYLYGRGEGAGSRTGAMTCVGLLGLATGRGALIPTPAAEKGETKTADAWIMAGLRALALHMNDSADKSAGVLFGE